MKILLTTQEGYQKDQSVRSKKRGEDRRLFFNFNGDDAPLKAVRAIMQKYGIKKEDL
jgi:hypothetical protein